jgi:ADP-ribose pyrophosphatase YjhB (NUDIX family)
MDFERRIPEGDTHERAVCNTCGFVAYENPKIVAGAVVAVGETVLLCRRAIEPRRGFWTLPAGFLELHETPEEGALREAFEEAQARIVLEGLLGIATIPRLSQVQMLYRARFDGVPAFAAGEETLELAMFGWAEIPWGELAFPSVDWALRVWYEGRARPIGAPAVWSG